MTKPFICLHRKLTLLHIEEQELLRISEQCLAETGEIKLMCVLQLFGPTRPANTGQESCHLLLVLN